MLIELPVIWIVLIDIALWGIIHISVAYIGTVLPDKYINTEFWLFKEFRWEKNGKLYESVFKIKKWKELLPDGSAIFKKGFRKKRIVSRDEKYFRQFKLELCRAEAVHWVVILFSPVFFVWNYWWVGYIMILYAIIANLPCILAQRYNRIRFNKMQKNFF